MTTISCDRCKKEKPSTGKEPNLWYYIVCNRGLESWDLCPICYKAFLDFMNAINNPNQP